MSLREHEQQRSRRALRKHKKQRKRRIETEEERKERLAKAAAERRVLRQRLAEDDDAVLTFKEWCAVNGLGERTGRRILASGDGPTVTMLSDKRIGISRRANRAWQEARARGAA